MHRVVDRDIDGDVDEIETIHLYVVREQPKKPYTVLPLLGAFMCLLCMVAVVAYSAQHPYYEHERLTIPVQFLPPKVFTAEVPIIPTGVKTYPATNAYGTLTITNGSVISQTLPAGFSLLSSNGASIITDTAVFVPAGNANGYGVAYVSAHTGIPGKNRNIPTLAVNSVEGSSLYIRNLSAFRGGRDAYAVKYVTAQDKQMAFIMARNLLVPKVTGLHYPCGEDHLQVMTKMIVTWDCQFVTYHVPSYMHVMSAKLAGKNILVDVAFVPPPARLWVR